jgi:hypothetical protein
MKGATNMTSKYIVLLSSIVLLTGCGSSGGASSVSPSVTGSAGMNLADADAAPSPGSEGATGSVGPTGATGAQGPAGAPGAKGATGPMGPAGPAGAQGEQGPAGPAGVAGAAGTPGAQGPQGIPGAVGATGAAGSSSITRANIYTVTGATIIVGAVSAGLAEAACTGANDVLLNGGCTWSSNGLELRGFGDQPGTTTYDATWRCYVYNPGGSGLPAAATATCLKVP